MLRRSIRKVTLQLRIFAVVLDYSRIDNIDHDYLLIASEKDELNSKRK